MVREFEGRSEQEAIDAAVVALGLEPHEFEVEVLSTRSGGLFGRNKTVRISVHLPGDELPRREPAQPSSRPQSEPRQSFTAGTSLPPDTDFEHAVVDFVTSVTAKMGFPSDVRISFRESNKLGIRLDTEHANILIGRKGKNLDALQLLANVLAGRFTDSEIKIVLDTEGYRGRREEQLIQLAHKVGDQVKRTRGSKLLEPMNPFERRLIHTTLNDIDDIGTESEGDGLYKQVRVFYRGGNHR
ncbi:MAG: protein jag [Spirochaetaceae bacterium]|nr:MAG: protein jag [Spirochaetaceae bacterium]